MTLHEGNWLKREVARTEKSQVEFAASMDVPVQTLTRYFRQPELKMRSDLRARLARALGLSVEAFDRKLANYRQAESEKSGSITDMLAPGVPIDEKGGTIDTKGNVVNIQHPDPRLIRYVPILNAVSAGPLIDRTGADFPVGIAGSYVPALAADRPAFALVVDGDSMAPKYEHGEIVVFRECEDHSRIINGRDYAVQLNGDGDNESTFKRLTLDPKRPEIAIARPINPDFRPAKIEIDLRKIHKMGMAIFTIHKGKA